MHTFESEGRNYYFFSFTVCCTWELPVEGKRQESNEKMKKQKKKKKTEQQQSEMCEGKGRREALRI